MIENQFNSSEDQTNFQVETAEKKTEFSVKTEVVNQEVGKIYQTYNYDLFKIMDGNRMVAKLDSRRRKLADDIVVALGTVANVVEDVYTRVNTGVQKVKGKVQEVNELKSNISDLSSKIKQASLEPPVGQGRRKRLSTRRRGNSKWMKTQRTRSVKR